MNNILHESDVPFFNDEREESLFIYLKENKATIDLTIKKLVADLGFKILRRSKRRLTKDFIQCFCIKNNIHNPFNNNKTSILESKLENYLKVRQGMVINLSGIKCALGTTKIKKQNINSIYVLDFAKKRNIIVILKYDKTMLHGITYWRKTKCPCEICKLSVRIKFKLGTNCRVTDYIAKKYKQHYKNDKSSRKKQFYEFLSNNLENIKNEMIKNGLNADTIIQRKNQKKASILNTI